VTFNNAETIFITFILHYYKIISYKIIFLLFFPLFNITAHNEKVIYTNSTESNAT